MSLLYLQVQNVCNVCIDTNNFHKFKIYHLQTMFKNTQEEVKVYFIVNTHRYKQDTKLLLDQVY